MKTFEIGHNSGSFGMSVQINDRIFKREQREILGKDLPFATAQAMTMLAQEMKTETTRQIQGTYDRPKRFTVNSLFVERAEKRDFPNQTAAVYFKDFAPKGVPAGRYLHPTIIGSIRPHKGFEKALIRAGHMKSTEYAVPGRKVKLDRFGNVTGGQIKQMLSQLRAGNADQFETSDSRERKRGRSGRIGGRRYFVASNKSVLPNGIYQRVGRGDPVLLFLFVPRAPSYRVMLPFRQINERIAGTRAQRMFDISYQRIVVGRRNRRVGAR